MRSIQDTLDDLRADLQPALRPALHDLHRHLQLRRGGRAVDSLDDFIRLPLNRHLPAYANAAADGQALVDPAALDRYLIAHHCAGLLCLLRDRLADGQVQDPADQAALRDLDAPLLALWRARLAAATGDPGGSAAAITDTLARLARGQAGETAALQDRRFRSFQAYCAVVADKLHFIGVAAQALLLRHSTAARALAFQRALASHLLSCQLRDDLADQANDQLLRGCSIPAALGMSAPLLTTLAAGLATLADYSARQGGFADMQLVTTPIAVNTAENAGLTARVQRAGHPRRRDPATPRRGRITSVDLLDPPDETGATDDDDHADDWIIAPREPAAVGARALQPFPSTRLEPLFSGPYAELRGLCADLLVPARLTLSSDLVTIHGLPIQIDFNGSVDHAHNLRLVYRDLLAEGRGFHTELAASYVIQGWSAPLVEEPAPDPLQRGPQGSGLAAALALASTGAKVRIAVIDLSFQGSAEKVPKAQEIPRGAGAYPLVPHVQQEEGRHGTEVLAALAKGAPDATLGYLPMRADLSVNRAPTDLAALLACAMRWEADLILVLDGRVGMPELLRRAVEDVGARGRGGRGALLLTTTGNPGNSQYPETVLTDSKFMLSDSLAYQPEVLCVAALAPDGVHPKEETGEPRSRRGSAVALAGPGHAWRPAGSLLDDSCLAASLCTAAAALLLRLHPALRAAEVRALLCLSALRGAAADQPLDLQGHERAAVGHGALDALGACLMAADPLCHALLATRPQPDRRPGEESSQRARDLALQLHQRLEELAADPQLRSLRRTLWCHYQAARLPLVRLLLRSLELREVCYPLARRLHGFKPDELQEDPPSDPPTDHFNALRGALITALRCAVHAAGRYLDPGEASDAEAIRALCPLAEGALRACTTDDFAALVRRCLGPRKAAQEGPGATQEPPDRAQGAPAPGASVLQIR